MLLSDFTLTSAKQQIRQDSLWNQPQPVSGGKREKGKARGGKEKGPVVRSGDTAGWLRTLRQGGVPSPKWKASFPRKVILNCVRMETYALGYRHAVILHYFLTTGTMGSAVWSPCSPFHALTDRNSEPWARLNLVSQAFHHRTKTKLSHCLQRTTNREICRH